MLKCLYLSQFSSLSRNWIEKKKHCEKLRSEPQPLCSCRLTHHNFASSQPQIHLASAFEPLRYRHGCQQSHQCYGCNETGHHMLRSVGSEARLWPSAPYGGFADSSIINHNYHHHRIGGYPYHNGYGSVANLPWLAATERHKQCQTNPL